MDSNPTTLSSNPPTDFHPATIDPALEKGIHDRHTNIAERLAHVQKLQIDTEMELGDVRGRLAATFDAKAFDRARKLSMTLCDQQQNESELRHELNSWYMDYTAGIRLLLLEAEKMIDAATQSAYEKLTHAGFDILPMVEAPGIAGQISLKFVVKTHCEVRRATARFHELTSLEETLRIETHASHPAYKNNRRLMEIMEIINKTKEKHAKLMELV